MKDSVVIKWPSDSTSSLQMVLITHHQTYADIKFKKKEVTTKYLSSLPMYVERRCLVAGLPSRNHCSKFQLSL